MHFIINKIDYFNYEVVDNNNLNHICKKINPKCAYFSMVNLSIKISIPILVGLYTSLIIFLVYLFHQFWKFIMWPQFPLQGSASFLHKYKSYYQDYHAKQKCMVRICQNMNDDKFNQS